MLANTLDGFWTFLAEQNLWKDTTPAFGLDDLTAIWDLHVERTSDDAVFTRLGAKYSLFAVGLRS